MPSSTVMLPFNSRGLSWKAKYELEKQQKSERMGKLVAAINDNPSFSLTFTDDSDARVFCSGFNYYATLHSIAIKSFHESSKVFFTKDFEIIEHHDIRSDKFALMREARISFLKHKNKFIDAALFGLKKKFRSRYNWKSRHTTSTFTDSQLGDLQFRIDNFEEERKQNLDEIDSLRKQIDLIRKRYRQPPKSWSRLKLLRAYAALINSQGGAGGHVSPHAFCKEAKVSVSSVINHFGNLQNLETQYLKFKDKVVGL